MYYLSKSIDGVPVVLRYYKIAEYLYQNYRPLCSVGEYAIWCDKEKYNFYNNTLDKSLEQIDYGYDDKFDFHKYLENNLAYLWANKDIRNAKNNIPISTLECNDGVYQIPQISDVQKNMGNYLLLHINNTASDKTINLVFGENKNNSFYKKFNINFNVRSGECDYIIRPSIDYYWYTDEIQILKVENENPNINITGIQLLTGD